ncbi:hypothetical protein ACJX0J_030926, partial [Zea mays]
IYVLLKEPVFWGASLTVSLPVRFLTEPVVWSLPVSLDYLNPIRLWYFELHNQLLVLFSVIVHPQKISDNELKSCHVVIVHFHNSFPISQDANNSNAPDGVLADQWHRYITISMHTSGTKSFARNREELVLFLQL